MEAEVNDMQPNWLKQATALVAASSSAGEGTCAADGDTMPGEGQQHLSAEVPRLSSSGVSPMSEIETAQDVVARVFASNQTGAITLNTKAALPSSGEVGNSPPNVASPMASTAATTAPRPYRLPPKPLQPTISGPRVAKPVAHVGDALSEGPFLSKWTVLVDSESASIEQKPVISPGTFTPRTRSTFVAAQQHLNTLLSRQARVVHHAEKAVDIADIEFGP